MTMHSFCASTEKRSAVAIGLYNPYKYKPRFVDNKRDSRSPELELEPWLTTYYE